MTSFRRLRRLQSFRDAFGSLIELNESDLQTVVRAVQDSGDNPDAAESVSDELAPAFSALAVLRRIAVEDRLDQLLDEINETYPDGVTAKKLEPLLSSSKAERELQAIVVAETEVLPIVLNGEIALDYRVSQHDKEIKLVPLFMVRVEFDEEVGGSDALTFQASVASLERIRDKIEEALTLVEESARVIGSKLLYDQTARKYL